MKNLRTSLFLEQEADITFHGCAAVYYKNKIMNSNLFWAPVHSIFANAQGFTCWSEAPNIFDQEYCNKSFCKYHSKIQFSGLVKNDKGVNYKMIPLQTAEQVSQ